METNNGELTRPPIMGYNIGVEDTEFFSENRKHDNALGPTERRPPPNDSANFQILPPIRPRFSDPPQNVTDWMFCVSSFLHPVLKSIFFIFLDILDYKLSCWQVCKRNWIQSIQQCIYHCSFYGRRWNCWEI